VKIVVRLSVGTHAQFLPGLRTTIFTTNPGAGLTTDPGAG